MKAASIKQPPSFTPLKRAARLAVELLFVCAMALVATLGFFLLQSRMAPGGAPGAAGYQLYIVKGGSMGPTISMGSIVLVRPLDPALIQAGDIITYRDPDPERAASIVTHRVIAVQPGDSPSFTTQGDANDAADLLPVPSGNLIGRVSHSVPYLGFLFGFVRTDAGIALFILLPALLIIAIELRKLFGYARALESEKRQQGDASLANHSDADSLAGGGERRARGRAYREEASN